MVVLLAGAAAGAGAAAAGPAAEEDVEDVAEAAERLAEAAPAPRAVVPVGVVLLALLRIAQHLVGGADLLEPFLGFLVARIMVRMRLARQSAESTLDVVLWGATDYAEHLVIITLDRHSLTFLGLAYKLRVYLAGLDLGKSHGEGVVRPSLNQAQGAFLQLPGPLCRYHHQFVRISAITICLGAHLWTHNFILAILTQNDRTMPASGRARPGRQEPSDSILDYTASAYALQHTVRGGSPLDICACLV